eukprot:SAG31_NODE_1223_length_9288_cov_8.411253_2_plen_113_part_00
MLENKSKNKNKLDERGKPIPDWTQIRLQSSLKILLAGEVRHTGAEYGTVDVAHLAKVEVEQGKIMDKLEEENQQLKGMNKQLEAGLPPHRIMTAHLELQMCWATKFFVQRSS